MAELGFDLKCIWKQLLLCYLSYSDADCRHWKAGRGCGPRGQGHQRPSPPLGEHLNIPKSETTKKKMHFRSLLSPGWVWAVPWVASPQPPPPVCAFPGTQRICWSRSPWGPFSSESVTVTWATHSPTSKAWAWGRRAPGFLGGGQGSFVSQVSRATGMKLWTALAEE